MLKIRIVLKLGLFHHLENLQEACKSQLVKLETRNPVKVKVTFIIVKSFRKQGSSNWSRILILARNMLFQSFEKFQEAGKSQKATICLERFSCCKQEIMIRSSFLISLRSFKKLASFNCSRISIFYYSHTV